MERLNWLQWGVIGGFVLTAASQLNVQVLRKEDVFQEARDSKEFLVTRIDPARRGSILTADGKALADDQPAWQLAIDYKNVPQSRSFFADMSSATGIPETELSARVGETNVITWPNDFSQDAAEAIRRVKTRWRANGVSVAPAPVRHYPFGMAAAGLVGAIRSGVASDGLEGAYERSLGGEKGKRVGLVDRQGNFLPMRLAGDTKPRKDGIDVETTIDSVLQQAVFDILREQVEKFDAESGVAIVMDPKTGDVLSMANWPTFDPAPTPGRQEPKTTSDLDVAYMGRLEPGSMFKVLTLAKALDAGKVLPTWADYCNGEIQIGAYGRVRCDDHHGSRAHGHVDLEKAIVESCNVSAAKWAMKIGRDPFIEFMNQLGLLDVPGLGLKGEVKGHYQKNEYAKLLQVADFGFGQSMTCTPLALADAFCSIGNNGVRMKTRLVKRVGGQEIPVQPAATVATPETANRVLGYMEGVIQQPHGTGYELRLPGYEMAGKTGTAQKRNGKGGYVSNFVGFLPAKDPKFMILVMIDHPRKNSYYGASVAGPAFKQIAIAAIRRFAIPPTSPVVTH